jgi:hypothetical protein
MRGRLRPSFGCHNEEDTARRPAVAVPSRRRTPLQASPWGCRSIRAGQEREERRKEGHLKSRSPELEVPGPPGIRVRPSQPVRSLNARWPRPGGPAGATFRRLAASPRAAGAGSGVSGGGHCRGGGGFRPRRRRR